MFFKKKTYMKKLACNFLCDINMRSDSCFMNIKKIEDQKIQVSKYFLRDKKREV